MLANVTDFILQVNTGWVLFIPSPETDWLPLGCKIRLPPPRPARLRRSSAHSASRADVSRDRSWTCSRRIQLLAHGVCSRPPPAHLVRSSRLWCSVDSLQRVPLVLIAIETLLRFELGRRFSLHHFRMQLSQLLLALRATVDCLRPHSLLFVVLSRTQLCPL